MKTALRSRAIKLRKNGWSYNIISQRLGVSKSTLSDWLREIPYTPNETVARRVAAAPGKSAVVKNRKKLASIQEGKKLGAKDIGTLSERDLFMLGIGLYIGEGAKLYESVRMINSDPNVIRMTMKWFREICGLSTENFNVAMHLYPDTPEKAAMKYWSKLTGVPFSQFGKTQIDKREGKSENKKRKLPYGTVHVTIRSRGNPVHGRVLHRRIMGWIEAIYNQMRV